MIYTLLDTAATTGNGGWASMIIWLVPLGLLGVYMIFASKKQKKEEQQIQQMKNSVSIGDELTTIGGIVGRVVFVKEDTVVIETSKEKTKIRILKWAIKSIDSKASTENN